MTELESTTANTYQVPASSHEAPIQSAPELLPTELDKARAQAMEQAISSLHELDTADIDTHRIEGIGGVSVAATAATLEGASTAQPETFNPFSVPQLVACGHVTVLFRTEELARDGLRPAA